MTLFEDADTSKRLKREKLSQALDILRARGVEI
jgi:hypothetical protein